MPPFTAILVVVLVLSAGNSPTLKHYPVTDMATCQKIIAGAKVLPKNADDGRGVQAMFCIERKD